MAKVSKGHGAAAIHKGYAQAAQHSPERTMHGLYTTGAPDAPRKQPKAARTSKSGFMPKSSKEVKCQKPWSMQGCILTEVAREFAVLLHVKYSVTGTHHLRRLYTITRAAWGTTVSPWPKSLGFQESPTDRFLVHHFENELTMTLWGGHIMARGSQDNVIWVFNKLKRQLHCEDGGQVNANGNYTQQTGIP